MHGKHFSYQVVSLPRYPPSPHGFGGKFKCCLLVQKIDYQIWILRHSVKFVTKWKIFVYYFMPYLTLWEPAYDVFVPRFWPKTSSFRLPYQRHSSSADCSRELFKVSKESASLLACTQKKFFGWGLQIFCEWRHKWSSFWIILADVTGPRTQPLKRPKYFAEVFIRN